MCYDVASGLKALLKYAKHRGEDPEVIASLEKKLENWIKEIKQHYHTNGFEHSKLLTFDNKEPYNPQGMYWGLIPSWIKNEEEAKLICNQTLNARADTLFEKPSFRNSAKYKRCLIYVDGFFEYHHFAGKAYPFYIQMKNEAPMALAGIWDEWTDPSTLNTIRTCSIVTTSANEKMKVIHNNPKLKEARMPVILPKEKQNEWLIEYNSDKDKLQLLDLCKPYTSNEMLAFAVRKLKGKEASGDTPLAQQYFEYPELSMIEIPYND